MIYLIGHGPQIKYIEPRLKQDLQIKNRYTILHENTHDDWSKTYMNRTFDKFLICLSHNYIDLKELIFNQLTSIGFSSTRSVWGYYNADELSSGIDTGTIINPMVSVAFDVNIGKCCMIHSGCVIEHECKIGDFVTLSPSVTLCGNVSVGRKSVIYAGATVAPNVKIGSGCTIGAGSIVLKDTPDGSTVWGNPAKRVDYSFNKGGLIMPEDKECCPVIDLQCEWYIYQHDSNGEVAICHCGHPDNPDDSEGNCTPSLCPLVYADGEYNNY